MEGTFLGNNKNHCLLNTQRGVYLTTEAWKCVTFKLLRKIFKYNSYKYLLLLQLVIVTWDLMFIGYELWMEGNDEGKTYVVKLKLVTFGEDLEPMSPFNHAALCDCCKYHISSSSQGFPSVAVVFPSANEGDTVLIPGSGRYPEVGNGTHSGILAWEIHGQRSLAGYSLWCQRKSDRLRNWAHACTHAHTHTHTHTEQSTASNGMESIPEVCELVLISIFTAEGTL